MEFISWLDANVLPSKRCTHFKNTAQTIVLRETDGNVNMKLEIRKISAPVVILLPEEIGQWRILKDGKKIEWWSRCDFLMLGEFAGKLFAIFMEFKKTIPDSNDEANVQLRWSLPILHFLVSVFNVDSFSPLIEEDFTIRYFHIGQKFSNRIDKNAVRTDSKRQFGSDEYKDIEMNYCVAPVVTLKQLLKENF